MYRNILESKEPFLAGVLPRYTKALTTSTLVKFTVMFGSIYFCPRAWVNITLVFDWRILRSHFEQDFEKGSMNYCISTFELVTKSSSSASRNFLTGTWNVANLAKNLLCLKTQQEVLNCKKIYLSELYKMWDSWVVKKKSVETKIFF